MSKKILVSSCLLGAKCAYDGKSRFVGQVKEICEKFGCVEVCPEMDGGLGCPRERHEITGGTGDDVLDGRARVMSSSGKDSTLAFVRGAECALKEAKRSGAKIAIMKSHSPSCGKSEVFAGDFDGEMREGCGVTTALLKRNEIEVFTEKEIDRIPQDLLS